MKTCPRCSGPTTRAMLFSLKDGKVIYRCSKHYTTTAHDPVVSWMRVGKVRKVSDG